MTKTCIYCGGENGGGYCLQSPDGYCVFAEDPDYVSPYNLCDECGAEMSQTELDGYAEHFCDPERKAAYQDWLQRDPDEDAEKEDWDYRL